MYIDTTEEKHFSTYGLALFFTLLPFEYLLVQFGIGSILRIVGICTMFLALFDIVHQRGVVVDFRISNMIIWAIIAVISGIWALDVSLYKTTLSMYINNMLMFLSVSLVTYNKREVFKLKNAYVIGLIILLIYVTIFPNATTFSEWGHRWSLATIDGRQAIDQNYLAAIMVMPFAIILYKLFEKKHTIVVNCLMSVLLLGVLYYILLSGSRSGLISICLITALFMWKMAKKRLLIVALLIGLVVIVLPYFLRIVSPEVLDRFSVEALTGKTDESATRLLVWTALFKNFDIIRFIFGYGVGNGIAVVGLSGLGRIGIHNFYLAHIAELGLIGLFVFMKCILNMCKKVYAQNEFGILFGFVGIMIMGIFLDLLTTKFFWSGMMLMSVCSSCSTETIATQE